MIAHPTSPQIGGTYRMRYGKLSWKCLFSLVPSNGHITLAVYLMLCITHVRFIFKALHEFILAFLMLSRKKRKAESLLVFFKVGETVRIVQWSCSWIETYFVKQTMKLHLDWGNARGTFLVRDYQHFLDKKVAINHYVKTKFKISHFVGKVY